MHTTNTQHGYVALSATLIVSAILLLVISQSVIRSSTSTQTLTEILHTTEAHILSHTCLETALKLFFTDVSYRGNEERTLNEGICDILPIGTDDFHNITVTVEATVHSVTSALSVTFDATDPQVMTSIWKIQ
ncbi:MAG: hypothetical protein UV60_C0024G0007 [Parcubacteria group bacterium GW2011_GWA2_43_11]|nr:MAG: hypothetical protein UV60_C0024G0007 [Parcubacteria group bacterium GW2011_GWA2_43_11]